MNKQKLKIWIPTLMIFSQIMLTVFVVYWLFGQYRSEKDLLYESVYHQYLESQEQVMDSLLLKHVINPVLGDSIKLTIDVATTEDTVEILNKGENKKIIRHFSRDSHPESEIIAINLSGNGESTFSENDSVTVIHGDTEDYLMRSVKLIVHRAEDQLLKDSTMKGIFPAPLDSSMFKQVFAKRLTDKGMDFEIAWLADSICGPDELAESRFFFDSKAHREIPEVNIDKYTSYLISQILPQLLFALLLLALTGSAFYITYLSLRKQFALSVLRESFISNISHELKTPVSTIKVALEAVKKYDNTDKTQPSEEYLNMAESEANRLDELIDKVLIHSKFEEKGELLNIEHISLVELTENVLNSMQVYITEQNAKINFIKPTDKLMTKIDQLFIESVIRNLIDNSLKYTGEHPEIELSFTEDKNHVRLHIKDSGPGIPAEYLPKVFDKFFRIPQDDKHNVKGYGLGLSFARMVMEQHDGSIDVQNLENGGCCFSLKFPKKG